MKVESLMIGDWVHVKAIRSPFQRTRDFVGKINEVDGINCMVGIDHSFFDDDELEPIPITPEILDENFNKDINVFTNKPRWYELNGYHDVCITQDGSVGVYYIKSLTINHHKVETFVRYIHELQHALRLCGIRKEIEL